MLRVWNGQVNESRTLSSPHRQTKIRNRPVPQLAGDAESPTVSFDDDFADRQSHAGSGDLHALILSAIQFFEDCCSSAANKSFAARPRQRKSRRAFRTQILRQRKSRAESRSALGLARPASTPLRAGGDGARSTPSETC